MKKIALGGFTVLAQFLDGHFPEDISPDGQLPERQFPEGQFPERTIPRTDISPNHIFFIYFNLFYRWYTKVTEANESQQKSINTNKPNAAVKLTYLQTKHPQSIFPRF